MLKTKKFTIIFTFLIIFSLFGTTFTPITVFAQADEQLSSSDEASTVPVPEPSDSTLEPLAQYNLYDTDKLYSEGVFMVNLNTNIIVCAKNPDDRMVPASLTKIMTAIVCLEKVNDMLQIVDCPTACTDEFWGDNPNYRGASTASFLPNQDNLTYKDCLYGLMLPSGCEAANIIAYNVAGGDISAFIGMMNETAQKIGCTNTHFSNTHGLYDKENYTSPRDLYLITRYGMENFPEFMEICGSVSYEMPANKVNPSGYTVYHSNKMMRTNTSYYYEGVKGVKTGSINEYFELNNGTWEKVETKGVRTLVTTCEKNGYTYLLVTMGAPYYDENGKVPQQEYPYLDHKALYDWAFSEFEYARVVGKNELVTTAPVDLAMDRDEIGLVTNGEYFTLLPKMEGAESIVQRVKPTTEYLSGLNLTAPIEAGTFVANLELRMGNETVASIPLVTESFVAVDQNELYRRKINDILKSPAFIISAVAVVLLIIAVIVIKIVVNNKKKEQRARRRIAVNSQSRNGKDKRR